MSEGDAQAFKEWENDCEEYGASFKRARKWEVPHAGIHDAGMAFQDHFDRAGELERIKRKARIYAQALFNEPGLQGSIQGFIYYLKNTQYGEDT